MATYTALRITHQTLTANTVDTVTLNSGYSAIEVFNRDASGVIYARNDGTDPVVGAAECYIIPAGQALNIPSPGSSWPTLATEGIKLISTVACAYSVTGN
jgi:hypothetical protein